MTPRETVELLNQFLLYSLIERPEMRAGHSFSPDPQSPVYRIGECPCTVYDPDDLFYNPAGYWMLERA